jgi:hypothetical protein
MSSISNTNARVFDTLRWVAQEARAAKLTGAALPRGSRLPEALDALDAAYLDAPPISAVDPMTAALRDAAIRALPLLVRLGDFIGNGPVDPKNPASLGERCDVILALRRALEALGVDESEMTPTCAPAPQLRAMVMYRDASGGDGTHEIVEGSRDAVIDALQGRLAARNASIVWATDARTGKLLAGFTHDGAPIKTTPTTQHGFFDAQLRTIYPPHARIVERVDGHTYRTLRGFTSTVLVYTDGWCIGFADPQDLGYADAAAMLQEGVAS